jgi:hypothetical protein
MLSPTSAPWPTFSDQQEHHHRRHHHHHQQQHHHHQQQQQQQQQASTINANSHAAYLSEAINDRQRQSQSRAVRSVDARAAFSASQLLQPDLEMQLLLRSAVSSFGEIPRVPGRHQDTFQRTTAYLANHIDDRTRWAMSLTPAGSPAVTSSRSLADLSSPISSASMRISSLASRASSDLSTVSLALPDLFPASRRAHSNSPNSRALVAAAGLLGPQGFLSSASYRPSGAIQTTLPTTVAAASAGIATPASTTNLNLVRRRYLQQQQENGLLQALLLQRSDSLRQEFLRRQRQERENRENP